MQVHVQKWGNSVALRIPQAFAKEIHIEKGSTINLSMKNGKLILTPMAQPAYSLEKLLSGATRENIHMEIDFGAPQGREIW